jgi:hypothetical protein
MKRGDLVEIEWAIDANDDDWHFFTWHESRDGFVGLSGADDPKTGDKHSQKGEIFYVPVASIRYVVPVRTATQQRTRAKALVKKHQGKA